MPLKMNKEVFITCAVTGSGETQDKSDHVPRSPKEIAESAIDAAKAGAAIVHCHVRDPETGKPSNKKEFYRELTDRIRSSDVDVILNLTTGMGADLLIGSVDKPIPLHKNTDFIGADERLVHIKECLPEICTLDCGTFNFGNTEYVSVNTPNTLREMAKKIEEFGVKPEIEVFETGHLWFAKQLVEEKIISNPVLTQICMGIPWGAPDDLNTYMALVNNVPKDWVFSSFSISRNEMPYVAAAILSGGNVRVGLEDNLYLERGVLASNAQLVEKAVSIITNMGSKIIGPEEVRKKLNLNKQNPN